MPTDYFQVQGGILPATILKAGVRPSLIKTMERARSLLAAVDLPKSH